jgi:hypothetical protein
VIVVCNKKQNDHAFRMDEDSRQCHCGIIDQQAKNEIKTLERKFLV